MGELPESYDPLEQWKADYNRDGWAPVEGLRRLAHMSRFIADYEQRSADAHLVLFGLTRDDGYLYRAVQVAGLPAEDSIEAGIQLFSSAFERAEPGTRWHTALLRGQARVLYTHADATSSVADFRQAVEAFVAVLAAIPPDDGDRPAFTATMAKARRRIADLTADKDTLATALANFEEAVASFPPAQPGFAALAFDAAQTAAEVAQTAADVATGDNTPGPFGRALALYEQAAASDANVKPAAAQGLADLAYFALEQWREQHRAEDLWHSIDAWGATARLLDDTGQLIQILTNLFGTLQEGREHHDSPGLLDEQIAALERLADLVPEADPRHPQYLVMLAMSHLDRFRIRHERADIDAAIGRLLQAVDGSAPAERPSLAIALGTALRERHQWSGELPDVDTSLAFWQALLDATPAANPDHGEWLGGVAGTLVDRHAISRDAADLDAAVTAVDEALEAVAGQDISAACRRRLRELESIAVQERYRSYGRGPDLERLILASGDALRDALRESEPGSPERTARAADHAAFLLNRYQRDSDQGDLIKAITVLEESAPGEAGEPDEAAEADGADGSAAELPDAVRARWLTLLGQGLLHRYQLWNMRQLDQLARAREYLEQAVALTPLGTFARLEALLGLASATEFVFRITPIFVGDRDLPMQVLEALDQVGDESVFAPFVCQDLANRLRQRAASGRQQPGDLDRAIELLQRAVSSGLTGFAAADLQFDLADALRERDQRSSSPAGSADDSPGDSLDDSSGDSLGDSSGGSPDGDRARAIAGYRASLPVLLETNVNKALTGGAHWGAWAVQRESWAEAAEAFSLAAKALDEIYLANVGAGTTVWLRRAPGLAAEAAYAIARAGRPADSALVLEAARFRAGSESLALVHGDLAELSRAGRGDLADRLRDSSGRWSRQARIADAPPPGPGQVSMSISLEPLRQAAGIATESGPEPGSDGP